MEGFVIKRNATKPVLEAELNLHRSGQLTGCSVVMRVMPQDGSGVTEYVPTITDAAGGVLEYQFQAGETSVAGTYWCEFAVTLPDGTVDVVPANGYFNLIIEHDLS